MNQCFHNQLDLDYIMNKCLGFSLFDLLCFLLLFAFWVFLFFCFFNLELSGPE